MNLNIHSHSRCKKTNDLTYHSKFNKSSASDIAYVAEKYRTLFDRQTELLKNKSEVILKADLRSDQLQDELVKINDELRKIIRDLIMWEELVIPADLRKIYMDRART